MKIEKVLCLFLLTGLVCGILSCSEKASSIQSVKPNSTIAPNEKTGERKLYDRQSNAELVDIAVENTNNFLLISAACGYYQAAYGFIPGKLDDLMEGFMLVWPESIHTKEPIKILNQIPDPKNPDHIGKVFYERIDDLHGYIYGLGMDIDAFKQGRESWLLEKIEIDLPDKSFKTDGSLTDAQFLTAMTNDNRMWYGYRKFLYATLSSIMGRSLARNGSVENSFSDFLKNNGYYVFSTGLEMLKNGINNQKVTFDIGDTGDGSNFYYDLEKMDLKANQPQHIQKCFKSTLNDDPISNHKYDLQTMVDCPPMGANAKSIFNSGAFSSYTFPDALLIDKEDLL